MEIEEPGYQRITLRIPRELHDRLMAAGKVTSKSMNAEIIARLEASFNEVADRLTALEEKVFDQKRGNDAIYERMLEVIFDQSGRSRVRIAD